MTQAKTQLTETLQNTIRSLVEKFDAIPTDRKPILKQLADFVELKLKSKEKVKLIFICTHNSRRSHISQIWAQAAAAYYGLPHVESYSGGTEATAFNPRAVRALEKVGFSLRKNSGADNPVYGVSFSENAEEILAFSKKFDSEPNPQKGFAAVMTCSHADDNCPVVFGMEKRISLPYDDPKDFDGTPQEARKYLERVLQIGTEILYAFSQVKIK